MSGIYGNAKPAERVEFEPPPFKFKANTYLQSPYGNTNAAQNTVFVTPAPLKETGGRPGVARIPR